MAKAKLYARRATAAAPGDPTFGLWATLALEFLARSSVASVHPVLVADPTEPQYLLYAFGYRADRAPRSIPAKAVFARCEAMIPEFTDRERPRQPLPPRTDTNPSPEVTAEATT